MVYLNLQIQSIAQGLTDMGWNPTALPPEALVAYSATAPTSPISGQLWLNSATSVLNIYSSTTWQSVALSAAESGILADLSANGSYNQLEIDNLLAQKQATLLSGTNIKTINNQSVVGSGNLSILSSLDALSDTVIVAPIVGQAISYNGTNWVNATPLTGVTDHTFLTNIGTNTHAQIDTAITRLANTSGTNTGDEDVTSIKTKLGITTLSGSNTGDQDLSGYSATTHNHSGVYEPVDATLLRSVDIGVSLQGYDANTVKAPLGVLPVLDGSNLTGVTGTLPSQTGNTGKYLTTNGTSASWGTVAAGGTIVKTEFVTAYQQVLFTVTYTVGSVDVYYNGRRLVASDYTALDGTSITLTTISPFANDDVVVVSYSGLSGIPAYYARTDISNTYTGNQVGSTSTVAYGLTIDLPISSNPHMKVTLTGNSTFVNPTCLLTEGMSGTIKVIQDATGGRVTAYGTYFKFEYGTGPSQVTTANSITTYAYKVEGPTQILCVPIVDWK